METKVKIEPTEVFFYLDKLVRKLKIHNLNEHPIKLELLTVLNEKNISPLQANETQRIIEPNDSFTVNLEYKDDRDKNYDSIIILTIYDLTDDSEQSINEPTPMHVPYHFRKVNLVNLDPKQLMNFKNLEDPESDESSTKSTQKDDEKVKAQLKATKKQEESANQVKKRSLFKKAHRFDNIFKAKKDGLIDKFGKIGENFFTKDDQQATMKSGAEKEVRAKKDAETSKDDKQDKADLKIVRQTDQNKNQTKKTRPDSLLNKTQSSTDDKNYSDDITTYEQVNSLRYEEDNIRKLAKWIFIITFFNLCYTIFLAFFNPLNQLWNSHIDTYSLETISKRCSSWLELNQLIKNFTCFGEHKT